MNMQIEFNPYMNASGSPNQNTEAPRYCSTCKKPTPVADPYKSCADCRAKKRLSSARCMQRKRASLLAQYGQDNGMMSPELKRKLENRADATLQGKKRPRTSGDFGERENTTDSGTKTKKKKLKEQVEYQTSAEMYNKLNICSKTKKYLFNGRFSIIANPEIDNNKRVTIVAKDLRKLGNVPFEGTSIKSFVGEDIFGATFQCSCLDPGTRKPVATLYNRNPNEIAFSPAGFVVHTPTNDIPRCKGTIKVISQDDDSHPLGIAGQKITIIVEH